MEYTSRVKDIIDGIENLSSEDILSITERELNTRITVFKGRTKIYGDIPYSNRIKLKDIVICSEYNVLRANYNYIYFVVCVVESKIITEKAMSLYRNVIKSAVEGLTEGEACGVRAVFEAIEGNKAVVVTSDIAQENNITRSVVLNGLRKLECGGLIKIYSKGAKGTEIKILYKGVKDAVLKKR